VGNGNLVSGMTIFEAVKALELVPDVTGGDALWLHRKTEGGDWYFVCAPQGKGFRGELRFRNQGNAELWDPVTGEISALETRIDGERIIVSFDLPQAGSCFVVFRQNGKTQTPATVKKSGEKVPVQLAETWKLSFPLGWGAPDSLTTDLLKAWKDLDLSPEGKAFSGTVTYTTSFHVDEVNPETNYTLDLGRVEMIAAVSLNGKPLRTLWAPPYRINITDAVRKGGNYLSVDVTGTWFNRLVYDAGLPEDQRKTWTISGPSKESPLRESGLLGPVVLYTENR
jgi:hypothetical protein